MDHHPTSDQLAFERRVERQARRFELRPLLRLLEARGYRRSDILFQSAPHGTSPSLVEAVEFDRSRSRPLVLITVNLGLLGDSSLLPSYFFSVIERTPDPERFYDFLRFFDHRLIEQRLRATYPEDDRTMFADWDRSRASLLQALGLASPGTLQWLLQLYFPELRVHVARRPVQAEVPSRGLSPGRSPLDGAGVLGGLYATDAIVLLADLTAEEERTSRGESWAKVVRQRLDERVLPRLRGAGLSLVVRLQVLQHASWAHVEAGDGSTRGYLGYDRLPSPDEASHTIVVYPVPRDVR